MVHEKPKFIELLEEALRQIEEDKPNDRSETHRKFAIAKTDLEKLVAYCNQYLR